MKYGYGLNRTEADLMAIGAEKTFIDFSPSHRPERAFMLDTVLRPGAGDVVLVLARGDLGRGRELPRIEKAIADKGATVEVVEPAKPPRQPPGPRSPIQLSDTERARVAHYWQGGLSRKEALAKIAEIAGRPVPDHWLNHHIGPRSGRYGVDG